MARIPTPENSILYFKTYIVPIDVPFLNFMDPLHEFGLCIDFYANFLTSKQQNWELPIKFKHRDAYIQHYQ